MNNIFTETQNMSYGGNVKNALGGMIFGIILFIISFIVLWLNEGHSVRQIHIADYISSNAVPVSADTVNRENDNKLISTSAEAISHETLTDGIVTIPNCLVLDRFVEMYQWVEDENTNSTQNSGGSTTETTTYSYHKEWSEQEFDSKDFHNKGYENPHFTIKSKRYNASSGELGAFKLTEVQTGRIDDLIEYSMAPQNTSFQIKEGMYYNGNDYANPSVGDIRITYSYAPSGSKISLVGVQKSDNTILPTASKNGTVYVQYDGFLTQEEMVEKFKQQNNVLTWGLRFLGWFLMFVGLNFIFRPLVVIAAFIPFLSGIVNFISNFVILGISLALSILTIGIAWFAYRPLLSVLLFVTVMIIIIFTKKYLLKINQKPITEVYRNEEMKNN